MKVLAILCLIGCVILSVSANPVEHPKIKATRSFASTYAAQQLSQIQPRDGSDESGGDEEPLDFSKCYDNWSDNVGKHIDKAVETSAGCLATSESARNALSEDTTNKDALEAKIVALTVKFEVCGDKDVKDYFKCHDDNAQTYKTETAAISSEAKTQAAAITKKEQEITKIESGCLKTCNDDAKKDIDAESTKLTKCISGKK